MIDVTLLGTGGTFPTPERHLSALLVRYNGHAILLDCGEGTQVAMRRFRLGFKQIDVICLTHFHADHIMGLPGLLLTIGNAGRTEPITIIGPKHVQNVVEALCVVAPIPYPLRFIELDSQQRQDDIHEIAGLKIDAQWVKHAMPCFAYRLRLERAGKFRADKAKELNVPVEQWSYLQKGESITIDGRTINPSDVLGEDRQGISICFVTDMRPSPEIVDFAQNVDLFVCEGNYGSPEDQPKAVEKMHCTFEETATMARDANANELWITHYSTSMTNPEEYLPIAEAIFANSKINQTQIELNFQN